MSLAPPTFGAHRPRLRLPWIAVLVIVSAPSTLADELELGVKGELRQALDRLVLEHDAAVVAGDHASLRRIYSADFCCEDLGVHDAEQMIGRWSALHDRFRDIRLKTRVEHVDRLASVAAVHCGRPFFAIDREDDSQAHDEFDMTFLVHLQDGRPRSVFAAFLQGDSPGEVLRPEGRFRSKPLDISFELPPSFLPVLRSPTGASLMELLLIDPRRRLRVQVIVHQSSYPTCLLRALSCDAPVSRQERMTWQREPCAVDAPGPFQAAACEFVLSSDSTGRALEQPWQHRMMYLSQDEEVLVQLIAEGPASDDPALSSALETIASSLTWCSPRADGVAVDHADRLLELNPRWNTVEDGIFRHPHPWIPLSMIVPDGLVARPLAGDREVRVRFILEDDPKTAMCLSIYECGDHSPCPDTESKHLVKAMKCVMCRPGAVARPKKVEKMSLLDTTGVCVVLPMACAAGVIHTHRAMALTRPPHHLQLQLVPGSTREEIQEELFLQTLTALEWD